MKTLLFIALTMAIVALNACQKNDTPVDSATARELLINKKWQIESNVSIDSMNKETDLYSAEEPYKKDDYVIYQPDSIYQINDNIILQSDTTAKIIDSGTWLLSADNKQLFRHSDMYSRDYEPAIIKSLTANKFVIETYSASDRSTVRTSYISVP